ncbi:MULTISPECIES: hypothetical protein [Nocardia]|uniref:ATP synthase I n=2 Tax=Nocardia TaxID=1817 RepID=K0FAP0_NOCB7|nr:MULTISPECIES: hypothetical protein [Nocardia]AFU04526.1 ATP synthase I [Nocardia brasiliensis ATCC 700358]KIA61630.1 ATP synthase I [Nocardia vulneris]OCF85755.1 ATP synthase I [Nocardia brasiliensis]SUB53280.1 Uncharacterised protein [Nocardia brasiliensis]GAJ85124.1 hypothetical protein NBRGN_083_00360 [Nocardia brasiliensis NBRC 14402]
MDEGGVCVDVNRLQIRRSAIVAIALGVLALAITGMIDRLLLGTFICAGLFVGWLNAQLTLWAITRIANAATPSKQRLVGSSAVRLLGITAVAILVAFLARPNGVGIFFGLALFQVALVFNTVVPELKGLRQTP